MSKKHFIALANYIRGSHVKFSPEQLAVLADFRKSQNGRFLRGRWLDYIAGACGPNGGDGVYPTLTLAKQAAQRIAERDRLRLDAQ